MAGEAPAERVVFEAWRQQRRLLVGRARKQVGTSADAEDVVQDAALAALLHAGELRDVERSEAWVARIVDRKATDVSRAYRRSEARFGPIAEAKHVPHDVPPAPCFCARVQARRLRPEYVEVLARVDERGERIGAVAAALGMTANAVTVRLWRARASLRAKLKAHCGTVAPQPCSDCGCLQRGCCVPIEDDSAAR